jgi:hypothetical protein
MLSRRDALAEELKHLIRDAGRDPDRLTGRTPILAGFSQVQERVLPPESLEATLFIIERLLPNLLDRLPRGPDCMAIRELFRWEDGDGQPQSLTTRYHHAAAHLVKPPSDFGRRQEPRLLKECARRFLALDFEDAEARSGSREYVLSESWGFAQSPSVHIIFPELPMEDRIRHGDLPSRDHIRLAKFTDLDTLLDLRSFFSRVYPRLPVEECTWDEATQRALRGDVVNVGGIHYNKLTSQLLEEVRSPFGQVAAPPGSPDALIDLDDGSKYEPEYSGDLVTYDYGMFAVCRNPYRADRRLVLINGVLTHGVLGACRAFTDAAEGARNFKAIEDACGSASDFAALIRVPVMANTIPAPRLYGDDLVAARSLAVDQ